MNTIELSFFDPNDITPNYQGPRVKDIEYTSSLLFSYTDKDDNVIIVGSAFPDDVVSITNVTFSGGVLTANLSNLTTLTVSDLEDRVTINAPSFTGLGVLSNSSGLHKPLVSNDPNLLITLESDGLHVESTAGGSGAVGVPPGEHDINKHSLFRLVKTELVDGEYGIPSVAGQWHRLTFGEIKRNFAGVTVNVDTYTFDVGTFYLNVRASCYASGINRLAIRKVSDGTVLLQGLSVNSATGDKLINPQLTGYIRLSEETELEVVQYTELSNASGLGKFKTSALFGFDATIATMDIFKVASNALVPNTTNGPITQHQIVDDLMTMRATYSDRTPVIKDIFSEWNDEGFDDVLLEGDVAYYIPTDNKTIVERNLLTGAITYHTYPNGTFPVGGSALVEGNIYILSLDASLGFIKFNTTTKSFTYTTFGLSLSGTNQYGDALYCPLTRNIYFLPQNATNFVIVNVDTQIGTTTSFGLSIPTTTSKFGSSVYHDGKIYCIPLSSVLIYIIDTVAGTAIEGTFGATLTGSSKWYGGVVDPVNMKIVGIPYTATDILVIDMIAVTATRTAMGATLTGSTKWRSAGAFYDGIIYIPPGHLQTNLLKINLSTMTAVVVAPTLGFNFSRLSRCSAVYGTRMILGNYSWAESFVDFDLANEALSYSENVGADIPTYSSSTIRFNGLVRSSKDVCYTVPSQASEIYALDPINYRLRKLSIPFKMDVQVNNFANGVTVGDEVYFAPRNANVGLKVVTATELGTRRRKARGKHINLIPIMASNSQDGFLLSGSGVSSGTRDYWKAFAGIKSGTNYGYLGTVDSVITSPAEPIYLQVQLPVPKRIDFFSYRTGAGSYCSRMALLGSTDGTNWNLLLDIDTTLSGNYILSNEYPISDNTEYGYYKLEFLVTSTSTQVALAQINLLQIDPLETPLYEVTPEAGPDFTAFSAIAASSYANTSTYAIANVRRVAIPVAAGDAWRSAAGAPDHWVLEKFAYPIICTGVAITAADLNYPRTVVAQGSNDGVNWTNLSTTNLTTDDLAFDRYDNITFTNSTAYSVYRLLITATSGNNAVAISRVIWLSDSQYDTGNWWGRVETVESIARGGTGKWHGVRTIPGTNKLIFIPFNLDEFGIYDIDTDKFYSTTFGQNPISGANKYEYSFTNYADQCIYAIPAAGGVDILKIDGQKYDRLVRQVFNAVELDYGKPALAPDGRYYSPPANTSGVHILTMDARTQTVCPSSNYDIYSIIKASTGAVVGPNGKLYLMPRGNSPVLEFDVFTKVLSVVGNVTTSSSNNVLGCRLLSDGSILICPASGGTDRETSRFFLLSFGDGIDVSSDILNSPYFD